VYPVHGGQVAHNDKEGRMAQKRKAVETLQEIKPLREPARVGYHCGVPMRRLSAPNSKGGVSLVLVCAKECGHQERPQVVA